eukprot:14984607-Heterocapsa_arctica.AAC.1
MAMAEVEDDPVVLHQRIAELHKKLAVALSKDKQGGTAVDQKGALENPVEVAPKGHAGQPEQVKGERPVEAPRAAPH